jgi:hypothetical protein
LHRLAGEAANLPDQRSPGILIELVGKSRHCSATNAFANDPFQIQVGDSGLPQRVREIRP